jgi:hypothetical protein
MIYLPRDHNEGQPMKRTLEAFGRTVARTYLAALAIVVYAFPVIFVIAMWALVGYALAFIMDGLGVSRTLGKGVLVVVFGIGFGAALFFSVYVWPRVSEVIGKIFDLIGEAASEAGTTASRKKKALIDCDPRELDLRDAYISAKFGHGQAVAGEQRTHTSLFWPGQSRRGNGQQ